MSNASYRHNSRPESRFALKSKSTGDWFSHVDYSSTLNDLSVDAFYAEEDDEVQKNKTKVSGNGKEGTWYKHDENRNYRDPIKSRLPSAQGRKIKEQHESSFGRIGCKEIPQAFMRSGVMREQVERNSSKIRGAHETPSWFVHSENECLEKSSNDSAEDIPVKTRLTSDEAFYYRDRNKHGSNQIFGRSSEDEDEEIKLAEAGWRPETQTGLHPRAESDLWFHHEEFGPERNNSKPLKRYFSQTVRETVEKSRGSEMLKILQQVPGIGDPLKNLMLRKKSFQEQATNSTMQYVLDQNCNEKYKEPIRCPRAVKPEGMETFKKNTDGSMAKCLGGYPDKAYKKDVHKVANISNELLEKHKGVNMAKAIVGELPPSGRIAAPRVIKPEAEKNALKNQGSMKDIFVNNNNLVQNHSEQFPNGLKLRSKEAKEIARRYHHGSMKSLLF